MSYIGAHNVKYLKHHFIDLNTAQNSYEKYKKSMNSLQTNRTTPKFFSYVTKTGANLYTYSRKPGNYNGTIVFEIDIMKKSSPINFKST